MTIGHNSESQLISFVERIERLAEEAEGIRDDTKEVFAEAKSSGFDVPTLRKAIRLRKIPAKEREEAELLLDTYMAALDRMEAQAVAQSVEEGA